MYLARSAPLYGPLKIEEVDFVIGKGVRSPSYAVVAYGDVSS